MGIQICLEHCGRLCGEEMSRNWTWPGSTTDREPYGVLCHELGHHCDLFAGESKWTYGSEYSANLCRKAKEPPISGYHDNEAEWFAEMFRVFVTNPALLKQLRPRTYDLLTDTWAPLGNTKDWVTPLGTNVPARVIKALRNKGAK